MTDSSKVSKVRQKEKISPRFHSEAVCGPATSVLGQVENYQNVVSA